MIKISFCTITKSNKNFLGVILVWDLLLGGNFDNQEWNNYDSNYFIHSY